MLAGEVLMLTLIIVGTAIFGIALAIAGWRN